MSRNILVFYGSYRRDRQGIKLARWIVKSLNARGDSAELIDAKAVDLPMLDRRFSDYADGEAPPAMAKLAERIAAADGFVFVAGEYNGGLQPGLKNLADHFLPEYGWRPAAIASYSAGPFAGIKAATAWRGTLAVMGMVVTATGLSLARIGGAFDADGEPAGEDGGRLAKAFPRFADDLGWWIDAAKAQRDKAPPPF
ncbi:NADPH-dependent FMN reductase [Sphingopyxis macrogoltabida]|uniref:NADPH-dependent FMN reductase n=1 Tax=Sphingopyxis macrogoltabida TaxID=33050 RepID=A0AAC8YXA3_SPHMC|nr:NADPH-dependent FMN reductase [Sphingopyxis macrogoltabida]ALJ11772.1 NADPH-dependent FMN reductase [Sphingopyxis macrogoltabida]AMU87958.1 NADPH-dependent FMN reductase [Sphingopyxis macrogoltabida]